MKQRTAKTVLEVLEWIEHNEHHRAQIEEAPGHISGEHGEVVALRLYNHHELFRIPQVIWRATSSLVQAGHHMDSRMYRASPRGRKYMQALGKEAGLPNPRSFLKANG